MMNTTPSTSPSRQLGRRAALRTLALAALCFLPLACRSAAPAAPLGTYYTRFPINVDRETCRSTNYRGGTTNVLVPINTEVELLSTRGYRSNMRMANGRTFRFEHIKKHTLDSAADSFAAFFSAKPTDLSKYSADEKKAIEKGMATIGMTRKAVLAAMGPPPAVGTLSLESSVWKYWSTRFDTFNVVFDDDGLVSEIVE